MTSEDIKHQFNNNNSEWTVIWKSENMVQCLTIKYVIVVLLLFFVVVFGQTTSFPQWTDKLSCILYSITIHFGVVYSAAELTLL